MDPKAASGVDETARKDELSEGELMEEDSSPSSHSNGQDTVSEPGEAKPQHMDEDKADADGPQAKKPRVEDTGCQDTEGGWEPPSKKQMKKIKKRRQKEKRQHQVLEDKYVATATPSEGGHLHARQRDVVDALATIACGDGKVGEIRHTEAEDGTIPGHRTAPCYGTSSTGCGQNGIGREMERLQNCGRVAVNDIVRVCPQAGLLHEAETAHTVCYVRN